MVLSVNGVSREFFLISANRTLSGAKRGRPKLHADRKAYKAQKERERRAKKKP